MWRKWLWKRLEPVFNNKDEWAMHFIWKIKHPQKKYTTQILRHDAIRTVLLMWEQWGGKLEKQKKKYKYAHWGYKQNNKKKMKLWYVPFAGSTSSFQMNRKFCTENKNIIQKHKIQHSLQLLCVVVAVAVLVRTPWWI